MGSESFLVLLLAVERKGANYLVKVSGPLGAAECEVSSEAISGFKNAALKDLPKKEQGTRLYEALLAGPVRVSLLQHRSRAQQEGKLLRLIVRLPQEADAVDWPVEFLHDTKTSEDLALAPSVTIARESPQWPSPRALEIHLPVRILVVIPEPTDIQPFGAQALWEALEAAVHPLTSQGQAQIVRTASGTERVLDESLRAQPWQVIHFMGQGTSRPAARYGTLSFEGSDRRTRAVNAQNFARLCEKCPSLGLAVLQATRQPARQAFEVVTSTLLESGLSGVVWVPDFSQPQVSALFARELYGALAQAQTLDQAVSSGRRAIATGAREAWAGAQRSGIDLGYWGGPVLFGSQPGLDFGITSATRVAATTQAPEQTAPRPAVRVEAAQNTPMPEVEPAPSAQTLAQQEVERKRLAEEFDVFLCHNIADKSAVKEIGLKLVDQGIVPWLDQWELRPGVPWQRLLEEQIAKIKSAAVFVGREGIGPWQRQELDGFLREFAKRNCPVIPVLLPGAPVQPSLPLFLMEMTWVDFRVSQPNPLSRLIWGITGKRPEIG
jgi:hypothetical protein